MNEFYGFFTQSLKVLQNTCIKLVSEIKIYDKEELDNLIFSYTPVFIEKTMVGIEVEFYIEQRGSILDYGRFDLSMKEVEDIFDLHKNNKIEIFNKLIDFTKKSIL